MQVECKVVAVANGTDQKLKNIAEITEDNNNDRDSTPGNVYENDIHEPKEEVDGYTAGEEDDDDFALVILSIKTGREISYTILITTIVTMLAGGIYLIKKYVLRY